MDCNALGESTATPTPTAFHIMMPDDDKIGRHSTAAQRHLRATYRTFFRHTCKPQQSKQPPHHPHLTVGQEWAWMHV